MKQLLIFPGRVKNPQQCRRPAMCSRVAAEVAATTVTRFATFLRYNVNPARYLHTNASNLRPFGVAMPGANDSFVITLLVGVLVFAVMIVLSA